MSRENDETIAVYDADIERYIERLLLPGNDGYHKFVEGIIKRSLKGFSKDIDAFEIGAGSGKYASYLESLGYNIKVSDAADSFVKYLKLHGHDAMKFNLVTDDFAKKYDYILAIAVLLHLTKPEVLAAIKKIYEALNGGGVFLFSIKTGDGEEFVDNDFGAKRYFNYYQPDEILDIVRNAGFSVIETSSNGGDGWDDRHLHIIVRKGDEG